MSKTPTTSKVLVPNEIRLQYLFFVANVASKSTVHKDNKFYLSCMKELLSQSSKFLKFNSSLIQRALRKRQRGADQLSVAEGAEDEDKHLYVSEQALIELLELCEPLEDREVDELLQMTKTTRFNQLRVMLLEKKEDIV